MGSNKDFDLKLIMDEIKDIISQTDEKGFFQYISSSCSTVLGYSQNSLIGKSAFDYIHPDDRSRILALFQKGIDTKGRDFQEYRFQHAQGHYIWLESAGKVLLDHEGEVVGAVISSRDITDRKILEEKQNNFFSLSIDLVGIANMEGYLVEINNAWEQSLGWNREELLNKPYLDFVHPDDREPTIRMADQLIKGEKVYAFNNRYLCKDGSYKWISWNSSPDAERKLIYFVARDVTNYEGKLGKLFHEIQQKDQYLLSVMETQEEMICRFLPDTTLTFVNKAYCKQFGFSEKELVGKKFIELISESDYKSIKEHLDSLSINLPTKTYIQKIISDDGSEIWQEWTDNAIFNTDNVIIEFQAVGRDITKHKQFEKTIAESVKLLEETQRVAGLGNYVVDLIGDTCQSSTVLDEILGLEQNDLHPLEVWPSLIHPDDREAALSAHQKSMEEHVNYRQECRIIRQNDGVERWVSDIGAIRTDDQGKAVKIIGTIMDITERKQAEIEAHHHAQRTEALLEIASHLNAELEPARVKKIVCYEACKALGMSMSAYLRYDSNERVFNLAASEGLPEEVTRAFGPLSWDDVELLLNKQGYSMVQNAPAVSKLPYVQTLLSHGIYCVAHSLIKRNGSTLGLLIVGDENKVNLFEDSITLLSGIADQAASAITNARLFGEAKNRLNQVQALRNIDLAITGSLDLRVTFQVVLDEVTKMLGTDAAAILRLNPHTGALNYEHWRGFRSRGIEGINIPLGEGYVGAMAINRKSVHIHDLREHEHDFNHISLLTEEGFVAYYAVPLIAKGTVLGVLEVFHRERIASNGEWLAFLETLAGQAAIAIDNAELFSKLERSNTNLLRAYDATIEGWAHALDLKDEETQDHSKRVTELTMRIAKKMGIEEEHLAHVHRGSLLHDIGKMGIPDSILLKPGKLTDEEWEIMRKHPVYAFEMLSPINYLQPALDIPYCHHEKWDGSGYPRGLKGEQIPLAARIFAVVDVYDALTSDRPYREAWSKEKALDHISELSGTHFDSRVVDMFIKIMKTFEG
ncbi:PAS domain S-box protein [Gudongella sp. DL1XJH-153]|uniref:PAS domain S-box protein n=1 Tax=Gudongella sp. DL1XJH-153 TaxID=3409804 RepID=UPI003BB75ED2